MCVLAVIGFRWVRRVHSGAALGSFGCALDVVGFMRSRILVSRFIPIRWVYSSVLWGTSYSFGFVGFIRAYAGGGWVHLGSLGSFRRALDSFLFIRAPPRFGSISFARALGVVVFILCSLGSFKPVRVRQVHLGAPFGSSGSFGFV